VADDHLARALRRALTQSPASRRALAEAAGIDHTLLARILAGKRRATPELCWRVMGALERWGTDCAAGASILRRALTRKRG
jgi:transcriptional regulator with XRE-family HTH domain